MPDIRELVEQTAQAVEQGTAVSKTTSRTLPGRNDPDAPAAQAHASDDQIEAINQVFALFRLNYHNQYYAAFPDAAQLTPIKKLWLESLAQYPVEQILKGARYAIENSEYLPTLHRMHECCRECLQTSGLPAAPEAFREACLAGSPKSAQAWSHPAVYLAGRDSGWFELANQPDAVTWPTFRRHYEHYCALVMRGETLNVPEPAALERAPGTPLSREEKRAQLRKLREETGI